MSGEPSVILVGSESTTRLVAALGQLAEVEPRFVLVGGLAVMARLTQAHRATQDLDALVTGVAFARAVAMLPTGLADEAGLSIAGVKVDTIEVVPETTWTQIAELEAPIDRLFTAAHLWAMQTASRAYGRAPTHRARPRDACRDCDAARCRHAAWWRAAQPRWPPAPVPSSPLPRRARVHGGSPSLDPPPVVADAVRWALAAWREQPGVVVRRLRGLGGNAPTVSEAEVEALVDLLVGRFASPSSAV